MNSTLGVIPALLFSLMVSMLPGCAGYHAGPSKPAYMSDVKTIAIPSFKNQTLEPRMEVLFASTLAKQIQQDGTYKITREEEADAVLQGTVVRIERTPARGLRSNFFQTSEFNLTLTLEIKLTDRRDGRILTKRNITGNTTFFVSSSNPRTGDVNKDERQAIPLAAEDASVKTVDFLANGW
jgi:hypothetical protein